MYFFERRIPADVTQVLKASALLSISEFQVFRLAHAHWYGGEADDEAIESHFLPYMFRDEVPHWVRSFTRYVLRLQSNGGLDPEDLGIASPSRNSKDVHRGRLYIFVIALTLISVFILAELAVDLLGITDCFFPPCY
jgi:hypothetical protein